MDAFAIERKVVGEGTVILRVQGEADLHTAPELHDALAAAIADDPKLIVVDLTGVTFIDSMMLGVLLGGSRNARPLDISLRIVVDDPHVRRIFEMTLLDQVFQLHATLDEATEGTRGPTSRA